MASAVRKILWGHTSNICPTSEERRLVVGDDVFMRLTERGWYSMTGCTADGDRGGSS